MGKYTKRIGDIDKALPQVIASIDPAKFSIPVTADLFKKNEWNDVIMENDKGIGVKGWMPVLPQVYDETTGDWINQDEDFEDCFVWWKGSKEVWCYKYCYGTFIYDIKSVGELEIILAREGFIYSFDV